MKAKHAILFIAIGYCLGYIGSLSGFMHRTEAHTIMVLAAFCKIAGVLLLAYKVVRYEGLRKFMEQ